MAEEKILSNQNLQTLYEVELVDHSEQKILVENLVSDKALLINFIVGSWCPLCVQHFKKIAISMSSQLEKQTLDLVLISTEPEKKIVKLIQKARDLSEDEHLNYIFERMYITSDATRKLVNVFDIRMPVFGFAKPATFLLDTSGKLFKLSEGLPNAEKTICDLNFYFKKEVA